MEMVEEEINQPTITPKRIKVEDIVEEKEDRISALPDLLLLEILSYLPATKSAIRTGTLSKRWRYLWTLVPTLIFIFKRVSDKRPLSDFFSFVDKTLTQCRQSKLRKLAVDTPYYIQFESQVNNWIRYAISCNVEELDLMFFNWDPETQFLLNEYFFINSCFTDLKLSYCIFDPNGAIGWKRLRSLYIGHGYLEEDLIENILSGSPLLETLELVYCYGYRRLDITSKSIKKLVFNAYFDPDDRIEFADVIEINAPNILSLTIEGHLVLWKLLLLNVSSLVEAELNFTKAGHRDETTEEEAEKEMLKGFVRCLRHVKELKIGNYCSKDAYKQVMLEKYDPDAIVHPLDDEELLEHSMGGSKNGRFSCSGVPRDPEFVLMGSSRSCSTGTSSSADSTSMEVQQLKEKIQKMEQEQAEREAKWEAQDTQRDARMKEMENKLKAFEELLHSRFPRPPPT